jgi:hypothetical protein
MKPSARLMTKDSEDSKADGKPRVGGGGNGDGPEPPFNFPDLPDSEEVRAVPPAYDLGQPQPSPSSCET